MKAYILHEAGAVNNLQLQDIPVPVIKDDEVLIQSKAISINPIDTKARSNANVLTKIFGEKRPVILGWDISGIVIETGKNVSSVKVGDEVFGMINFIGIGNAYAEYVAAPASQIAVKPNNITHQEAAASSLAALTAWQSLQGNIKQGDRVLIHAASGGVGHFAVQIAKHLGAYVIGTSSTPNRDFILQLGADEHIDYTQQKVEEATQNIDFVFDCVFNNTLSSSIEVTKPNGIILNLPSSAEISPAEAEKSNNKNIQLTSIMVSSNGNDMQQLASLLENKTIKPNIYKQYSFEELPQAHTELEKGRTVGKIVLSF